MIDGIFVDFTMTIKQRFLKYVEKLFSSETSNNNELTNNVMS